MNTSQDLFIKMTSPGHLFDCWDNFKRGKQKRKDIQCFVRDLEDNIFQLSEDLQSFEYKHSHYENFQVSDPKQRSISKANVRDRLVHHMLHDMLYPIFDKHFIHLSLASRTGKGIHFGINHLNRMIRKVSCNHTRPCFALKMDVRRFFDTVDHAILKSLIRKKIDHEKILQTTDRIIDSFTKQGKKVGIPLGNVTSQLFANIYLHELDDYIKQTLREKYYLRYCDDFIILSNDAAHLQSLIDKVRTFLKEVLHLELHPNKIHLKNIIQGVDFIGYVLFSKYKLLRSRSKRRMKKRLYNTFETYLTGVIDENKMDQQLQSYLGMLSHASEHTLSTDLKNAYWLRGNAS